MALGRGSICGEVPPATAAADRGDVVGLLRRLGRRRGRRSLQDSSEEADLLSRFFSRRRWAALRSTWERTPSGLSGTWRNQRSNSRRLWETMRRSCKQTSCGCRSCFESLRFGQRSTLFCAEASPHRWLR